MANQIFTCYYYSLNKEVFISVFFLCQIFHCYCCFHHIEFLAACRSFFNGFDQKWIQLVMLGGAISAILLVKSHNGSATVKEMKYTSQHC